MTDDIGHTCIFHIRLSDLNFTGIMSMQGAFNTYITSMDDIYLLAENQYLLERPVCLAAENPELFEKALRVFNGIALYDGTWELDEEHLERFYRRYGLVSL